MTTLHQSDHGIVAFNKDAPETLLNHCRHQLLSSGIVNLDRDDLLATVNQLAADGYRILAIAMRCFPALPETLSPIPSKWSSRCSGTRPRAGCRAGFTRRRLGQRDMHAAEF